MPVKTQVMILVVSMSVAYAFGRYTTKPEIKQVEVVKIVKEKEQVKDAHTVTRIVKVQSPNGEIKTVTEVDNSTTTKTETQVGKNIERSTEATRPNAKNPLLVSVLGGYNFNHPEVVYGLSVSKKLVGPITTGVWGLNSGTIGLSVGVEF